MRALDREEEANHCLYRQNEILKNSAKRLNMQTKRFAFCKCVDCQIERRSSDGSAKSLFKKILKKFVNEMTKENLREKRGRLKSLLE